MASTVAIVPSPQSPVVNTAAPPLGPPQKRKKLSLQGIANCISVHVIILNCCCYLVVIDNVVVIILVEVVVVNYCSHCC